MRFLVIAFLLLLGQQQPAPKPAFEVATIKRNLSLTDESVMGFQPGGRFRAVHFNPRLMIARAYGTDRRLQPQRVIGGPDWLARDFYDITAKVSGDLAALSAQALFPNMPLFLQSLLEDRFKLRVHWETRELPVYVLMLDRADGTLGPMFGASSTDCDANPERCRIRSVPGHFSGARVPMPTLTNFLANTVDRMIIDRTGLSGSFDVDLDWSADQPASDKPSIFSALQEQWGLKLKVDRAATDVLVIDAVERPTED